MANQSSRELVLERRKALSQGGKKAISVNSSTENRVRSAKDARLTRTEKTSDQPISTKAFSNVNMSTVGNSSPNRIPSINVKRVAQPSRELVLARREALSRRGKTADTSKDRTRVDLAKNSVSSTAVPIKYCCDECKEKDNETSSSTPKLSVRSSEKSVKNNLRRTSSKRRPIQNQSRALVLARREAQSKHGKTAGKQPTSAASVARQGDPDMSSRDISKSS